MAEPLEIVTIDGPSGVGKSTVSRKLAALLGYTYLDTGAMYRAVALECKKLNINLEDESSISSILANLDLQLLPAESEKDDVRVILDGEDVSERIRTEEISMVASAVSALPSVRKSLTALQQRYGAAGKVVAEGRDTGTVVFPDAAWKFFLDAVPEERARRRIHQLRNRGIDIDEEAILRQIITRDRNDSQRTVAPLQAPPDAVLIDSTRLSADEVIRRMLAVVQSEVKRPV